VTDSNNSKSNKGFRLKTVFITFASIIVLIYLLIWAFSPKLAHLYINDYLQSQHELGLSENSKLRYNPFTSHLSVTDLSILRQQETVFRMNNLEIELRLHQLISNNLYASEFQLDNLGISIIKNADTFEIAGIDINKLVAQSVNAATENTDDETTDLQLVVPNLNIHNSEIDLNLNGQKYIIIINDLSVSKSKLSHQKQDINLALQASINGAPYTFSAKSSLREGTGSIQFSTMLNNLLIERFAQFLPAEITKLNGKMGLEGKGEVKLSDDEINLSIPNLAVELIDYQVADSDFEIQHETAKLSFSDIIVNLQDNHFSKGLIASFNIHGGLLNAAGFGSTIESERQQFESKDISLSMDDSGGVELQVDNIAFDTSKLMFLKNNIVVDIETAGAAVNKIKTAFSESQPLIYSASGDITLESFSTHNKDKSNLIAGIKSIHFDGLSIEKKNVMNLQFNELSFLNNEFSNPIENDALPALLSSDAIKVQSFVMEGQQVSINNIILDGLNSHIYLGKNKHPDNFVIFDLLETEKEIIEKEKVAIKQKESLQATNPEDLALPIFKIDKIAVINTQSIKLVDNNVTPTYERQIFVDKLTLENIDANFPDNESPFIFKGRSDKYTKYDFQGMIKPFTEKTNFSLSGSLTELSLPTINPYLQQMLGFDVASGELDIMPTVTITESIIKGDTLIKIRGLELDSKKQYQSKNLKSETALPVNTALGMLKDDKGNLKLAVPMQGNVDNPDFGFGGFISLITKKAIYSAAQGYLMNTFLPYGKLLSIAFSAGQYVMKTRFEHLPYEPMQTSISQQQQGYVDQFIALMQSKTEMQVKVCATATLIDIPADKPELKTPESKVIFLESIANTRMTTFKEYVVSKGIESARILLCSPEVDLDKKAVPKIEIAI